MDGQKNDQTGHNNDGQNQDKEPHARGSTLSSPRPVAPFGKQFGLMTYIFQDIRRVERTSASRSTRYLLLSLTLQFGFRDFWCFGDDLFKIFHLPAKILFLPSQFILFGFYGRSRWAFAGHHFKRAK